MMEIDTEHLKKLQTILDFVYQSGAETAAVAGGAIREMLFQKPIKDIDVFYTGELKTNTLEELFSSVEECSTKYDGSSFTLTHNIKEKELVPIPIQLIQVEDVVKTINQFPTPIGRVYYNEYGLCNLDEEIFVAHQKKTIWFDKITNITYYNKYVAKYNDYVLKFMSEGYKPKELMPVEATAFPTDLFGSKLANSINHVKAYFENEYSNVDWSKVETASHSL